MAGKSWQQFLKSVIVPVGGIELQEMHGVALRDTIVQKRICQGSLKKRHQTYVHADLTPTAESDFTIVEVGDRIPQEMTISCLPRV